MNILYFSRRCNHCKDFILELKNLGLINEFKFVCVDGNRNLPKFVKSIPTIKVTDYEEPLSGDFAFKWIAYKRQQIQKEQQTQNEQELGPSADGYSNSTLSYGGIDSDGMIAADGDLGGFSGLITDGTILDQSMQNDPRFDNSISVEARLARMKSERGI